MRIQLPLVILALAGWGCGADDVDDMNAPRVSVWRIGVDGGNQR